MLNEAEEVRKAFPSIEACSSDSSLALIQLRGVKSPALDVEYLAC